MHDSSATSNLLKSNRRRQTLVIWVFFALFAGCVLSAWAWFNTGLLDSQVSAPKSHLRIWFTAETNIPGYLFIPGHVSDAVKHELGTTNILSGTFYRIEDKSSEIKERGDGDTAHLWTHDVRRSTDPSYLPTPNTRSRKSALDRPRTLDRITIFLASWPADDNKGFTAIHHTPDVCWGGSGWKPINLGQPQQITVEIPASGRRSYVSDRPLSPLAFRLSPVSYQLPTPNSHLQSHQVPIPFDFRIFELPESRDREATAWCALAGGQPLIGTIEWGNNAISEDPAAYHVWSRAVLLRQLFHAAKNRLPVRREKQFLRYSVPQHDWKFAFDGLKGFGSVWLSADQL